MTALTATGSVASRKAAAAIKMGSSNFCQLEGARAPALGLDIGSTTVKAILLAANGEVLFDSYERHLSCVRRCVSDLLTRIKSLCPARISACITGSSGIAIAEELGLPFIQEVLACNLAIAAKLPDADAVIELGGEDAKLTYLTGGLEQRMNETCAGGTGAFIDQMAAFIGTDASGLDQLALRARTIYPLASRCGVFAKSDILPLLNEGCRKEDIAASIMQAVASQTISGLAQGRPIRGKVVFLGGPLRFLKSLAGRFRKSLKDVTEAVFPEDGHFFVALGAALHCQSCHDIELGGILDKIARPAGSAPRAALPALFPSAAAYASFKERHAGCAPATLSLESASGDAWLGFDCGSTTVKAALIDGTGALLHSAYAPNRGDPLQAALAMLKEINARKRPDLTIRASCGTGYGSGLLAAALHLDLDEVETVAHYKAAAFFDPHVSFILDIGGQDIKCMHIRNGQIARISLNEACSAGCGSFIENFADSLGMSLPEFVEAALTAQNPVDLGSRCTVFMNSRVKQAQKEGAQISDIAAGLAYSVVRNAIFKVLKLADPGELGRNIVVQGGAFLNDALLAALELELGLKVTRPAISGLMGAFGAALIARQRSWPAQASRLLDLKQLERFSVKSSAARCSHCANSCLLTISRFGDGQRFVSGNRCERGAEIKRGNLPNLAAWKYRRLFAYQPLPLEKAPRGAIGIPRSLNIYENYPLWFSLLTALGFRVELSGPSTKATYYSAYDTIPSQTVCYPAKLCHGHIQNLCDRGLKAIFFPCVQRERQDADFRHGTYNCPVVIGYPEVIALNMDSLKQKGITFIHDFLPLDRKVLAKRLAAIPFFAAIPAAELEAATAAGFAEMDRFRQELAAAGEAALASLKASGQSGLIIAGHPYHVDPEIHHGIAELVIACGFGVLTEDSVAHLMPDPGRLRVVDQWAYHSRLYRAGAFAASQDNLAVLQLISFGCGLDAVTSDQLEEIAARNRCLYAQIKIDEGANLGQARIRIRSLLAAMREGKAGCGHPAQREHFPAFLPEMRKTHTLLVPQMSPLHFQFAAQIFGPAGYNAELLPKVGREDIETGLRHVNNDACYPAIVVVGQLLNAVKSGRHDPDKIALVISQTGGGCRATNYIAFLRKALRSAGLGGIPIANFSTTQCGPGIRLNLGLLSRLVMAGHYGDALMRARYRLRPYEREKDSTEALISKWSEIAAANIESCNLLSFQRNMFAMVRDFDNLPLLAGERKPRVGLVGEILLKYHPDANNNAAGIIEAEGGEAVVPDIMDFLLYGMYSHIFNYERLGGPGRNALLAAAGIAWQQLTRLSLRLAHKRSRRFAPAATFARLRNKAAGLISLGHSTGEGWLLAAEMVKMLESGVSAILCMQPFGCLPNHIVGKGVIRELRRRYPHATIMALDYDAGASEVNQMNRIKLMMRSGFRQAPGF